VEFLTLFSTITYDRGVFNFWSCDITKKGSGLILFFRLPWHSSELFFALLCPVNKIINFDVIIGIVLLPFLVCEASCCWRPINQCENKTSRQTSIKSFTMSLRRLFQQNKQVKQTKCDNQSKAMLAVDNLTMQNIVMLRKIVILFCVSFLTPKRRNPCDAIFSSYRHKRT